MSDEKKKDEGLSEEELNDVSGGAGNPRTDLRQNGIKCWTSSTRLQNGTTQVFIKSEFGSLPGGGQTVIKQGSNRTPVARPVHFCVWRGRDDAPGVSLSFV